MPFFTACGAGEPLLAWLLKGNKLKTIAKIVIASGLFEIAGLLNRSDIAGDVNGVRLLFINMMLLVGVLQSYKTTFYDSG